MFVPKECRAMHTKAAAFMKIPKSNRNARRTKIAHQIFIARITPVSAHAPTCCVDQTRSANLKTMRDGAVAVLDSPKVEAEIAFLVSFDSIKIPFVKIIFSFYFTSFRMRRIFVRPRRDVHRHFGWTNLQMSHRPTGKSFPWRIMSHRSMFQPKTVSVTTSLHQWSL